MRWSLAVKFSIKLIQGTWTFPVVMFQHDTKIFLNTCRKRCILDLQRKNGRAVPITAIYQLNTRDIPIRQHFQVTFGTWKVFKLKHLTSSGLSWDTYYHTQITQINAPCAFVLIWKTGNSYLLKSERSFEQEIWTPVTVTMTTSCFKRTTQVMTLDD